MFRIPVFILLAASATAQQGWWVTDPVRLIQTNLRETDARLDPKRLGEQLSDFRANALLMGMGGIVAYYPAKVAFHYPSPYIPAGRDPFGEVLKEARARGIRVIGRFDLSKLQKPAFDAHPEWFFRKGDGEPVIYNGLYSTCINAEYYRGHAMTILTEALDRYEVDGLFFNMFGNQSTDYSGRFVGHCHCESCKRRFREQYKRELPAKPDADYREFLYRSSRDVAGAIAKLIHEKRPKAGFFTYIQDYTDGIMSESNTSVRRALPLWPYASSDNVNRARNSELGKAAVNLCMSFVDYPWRFSTVPQAEHPLRLWQNVAHGGALALNMHGTMDQQDRQALDAARPVFRWLAEHAEHYRGLESAARVLLLGSPPAAEGRGSAYRGLFRMLTEEHIPFAVSDNLKWLGKREFDLVVTGGWAPKELDQYTAGGGKVLVVTPRPPEFEVARVVREMRDVQGYIRVRERGMFPSLAATQLLMLNGDFTEVAGSGMPPLTLVPPSMFGPPEKVHVDQVDTTTPGLVRVRRGKGEIVWVPWDTGALYYLHSLPAHKGLVRDLIDGLLSGGRQLRTNAHPMVETVLMKRQGRTQVHVINVSGHSQTGYFAPHPQRDVMVAVKGEFSKAQAVRKPGELAVKQLGGYTEFAIPLIEDYELVELREGR
jgi:hypothetical protein